MLLTVYVLKMYSFSCSKDLYEHINPCTCTVLKRLTICQGQVDCGINTFLFYFYIFPVHNYTDNYTYYPYLKIRHGDLCILLLPKLQWC